jgi:hypothetical protein
MDPVSLIIPRFSSSYIAVDVFSSRPPRDWYGKTIGKFVSWVRCLLCWGITRSAHEKALAFFRKMNQELQKNEKVGFRATVQKYSGMLRSADASVRAIYSRALKAGPLPRYQLWAEQPHHDAWEQFSRVPSDVASFFSNNKENCLVQLLSHYCQEQPKLSIRRSIVEIPFLAKPNRGALNSLAQRYAAKYGITIHVVTLPELAERVSSIVRNMPAAGHVGFVVARESCIDDNHVTPMIGFFSPNACPEFLNMDVVGPESVDEVPVSQVLPSRFSLCHAQTGRQIDRASCRIGAMTLLRNALLSLRAEPKEFWTHVRLHAEEGLPPAWTCVEQRQRTDTTRLTSLVVRDAYANDPVKRARPRTIEEYNREKSEPVTLEYSIFCPYQERGQFTRQSLQGFAVPDNFKLELKEDGAICTIHVSKTVHTYLARKGLKEMNRLYQGLDVR